MKACLFTKVLFLLLALCDPKFANAGVFRCQVGAKTVYQETPCTGGGSVLDGGKWSPHSVEADIRKQAEEQRRQDELAAKRAEQERFDRENAEELRRYQERRAAAYVARRIGSGLHVGMSEHELLKADGWGYPDSESVVVKPDGKVTMWTYDADDRGLSWVRVTMVRSRVVTYEIVK